MIKIGCHFTFEASHKLPPSKIYGKCSNLHGHRYELQVEVTGNVKTEGWICNFNVIKALVNQYVLDKYDHAYLNDFFEVPTAEAIAIEIYNNLLTPLNEINCKLNKIKLYETQNNYAEVTND